jgi:hypothetical protein
VIYLYRLEYGSGDFLLTLARDDLPETPWPRKRKIKSDMNGWINC